MKKGIKQIVAAFENCNNGGCNNCVYRSKTNKDRCQHKKLNAEILEIIAELDKLVKALICCDNKNPLLTCSDCPYEKYSNCTARLVADCKKYLQGDIKQ